jgi:sugar lactone lactonase YvrE
MEGRIRGATVTAIMLLAASPAGVALSAGVAGASGQVQTFVTFDPAAGEFPEGIAVDKQGNVYVGMIELDQIWRIDPSGDRSVLVEIAVPGEGPAGLAVDPAGTVYAAVPAFDLATGQTDPATRGVYRIRPDGTAERLPGTEAMVFPNDVTLDKQGNVYATDTSGGAVWRVPRDGSAELWSGHPLLAGDGSLGFGFPIGANGIAFRNGELIVANTERGRLVRIPVGPDGAAGEATVLAESTAMLGADGIALDAHGEVYLASAIHYTVLRVGSDGVIETLATAEDGLNQPSTLAFGTGKGERQTLFVANFSIFSPTPTPGVLKISVGVPGQPLP